MSRTFSTNCGSVENLKFSTRSACNPKAWQIRTMAFCDRPVSAAMSRVLQCVPLAGIDSSVLVTTSSICRSVIFLRAPTRGSSKRPSRPSLRNRSRHLPTVAPVMCSLRCNLGVTHSLFARKNGPGTHCHSWGRFRTAGHGCQLIAIPIGDFQSLLGTTSVHAQVCCRILTHAMTFSLRTLARFEREAKVLGR